MLGGCTLLEAGSWSLGAHFCHIIPYRTDLYCCAGKEDFRTEVLEMWFSKTGCIKISKGGMQKAMENSDSEGWDSDSD